MRTKTNMRLRHCPAFCPLTWILPRAGPPSNTTNTRSEKIGSRNSCRISASKSLHPRRSTNGCGVNIKRDLQADGTLRVWPDGISEFQGTITVRTEGSCAPEPCRMRPDWPERFETSMLGPLVERLEQATPLRADIALCAENGNAVRSDRVAERGTGSVSVSASVRDALFEIKRG